LTNPDHKITKTHLVKCADLIPDEALDRLRKGVELSDGMTRPAVVTRVRDSGKYSHIEIRITEGRNRQVRRMIEAIGSKVLKLVRTGIGPIEIAGLKIGTCRPLEEREIELLSAVKTRRS
jgi:23S rRNA pseudouridine2605 synthase